MANEAHKIKLLVLWDILCKNTDENHALNTDEISELLALRGLNVSRKILVQDIATLCDNGYEVLSYKKKYHYYYVVNRSLETAEVVMLADVINASKLPVAQKKALVGRLAETLCTHQAESISKHIISLDKCRKGSSSFIYNVDAIERAINENKQISFLYFNYDEKHKKVYRKNGNRYTVSPAFMVWNKDNYYLLCFSKGHDDIVTYRLDKMESVKVEELEREAHPEYELFNTEEYRKQVFSMFGGESQNVTLLFTANILSDMFDRFGDDIRIKKADEETYSVDVTVQISKTFFAWIVGTQDKVKIKSPRKVIDQYISGNADNERVTVKEIEKGDERHLLTVNNFSKKYASFTAENISFAVKPGSIVGLIGENGAGKSTVIKSILGLVQPGGGDILFDGRPINSLTTAQRQQIAFVMDNAALPCGRDEKERILSDTEKIYAELKRMTITVKRSKRQSSKRK